MLIRVDDKTLVEDLCAHYRRSGFRAERMGGAMIEVAREAAPTPEQERHEVRLHLRVWEALNPDSPGVAALLKRYPKAVVRKFNPASPDITEGDAVVAYLQMLGTLVDFNLYDNKANLR